MREGSAPGSCQGKKAANVSPGSPGSCLASSPCSHTLDAEQPKPLSCQALSAPLSRGSSLPPRCSAVSRWLRPCDLASPTPHPVPLLFSLYALPGPSSPQPSPVHQRCLAFTQPRIQAYVLGTCSMPDVVPVVGDAEESYGHFVPRTLTDASDTCQPLSERLKKARFLPSCSSRAVEVDRDINEGLQDSGVSDTVGGAWSSSDT